MSDKYFYKCDNSTIVLEELRRNSLRTEFKVLSKQGKDVVDYLKVGHFYLFDNEEIELHIQDGSLIKISDEDLKGFEKESLKEPEVSNTNPPKNLQKNEKIEENAQKTNIFAPFKFTHTKATSALFGKKEGEVDIGRIKKIITNYNIGDNKVIETFVINVFTNPYECFIEESDFKDLNPVFFDDFEYHVKEKNENGSDGAPGV